MLVFPDDMMALARRCGLTALPEDLLVVLEVRAQPNHPFITVRQTQGLVRALNAGIILSQATLDIAVAGPGSFIALMHPMHRVFCADVAVKTVRRTQKITALRSSKNFAAAKETAWLLDEFLKKVRGAAGRVFALETKVDLWIRQIHVVK